MHKNLFVSLNVLFIVTLIGCLYLNPDFNFQLNILFILLITFSIFDVIAFLLNKKIKTNKTKISFLFIALIFNIIFLVCATLFSILIIAPSFFAVFINGSYFYLMLTGFFIMLIFLFNTFYYLGEILKIKENKSIFLLFKYFIFICICLGVIVFPIVNYNSCVGFGAFSLLVLLFTLNKVRHLLENKNK